MPCLTTKFKYLLDSAIIYLKSHTSEHFRILLVFRRAEKYNIYKIFFYSCHLPKLCTLPLYQKID